MDPAAPTPVNTGALADRADAIVQSFTADAASAGGFLGALFLLAVAAAWLTYRHLSPRAGRLD